MAQEIFRNPEGVAIRRTLRNPFRVATTFYIILFSQGSRETRQPWAGISERFQRYHRSKDFLRLESSVVLETCENEYTIREGLEGEDRCPNKV